MNTLGSTYKLAFEKIAPAKSMAQQRFMGAELRRAREGEETVTGMSIKKLRDFARIPKKKRGKLPEVVKKTAYDRSCQICGGKYVVDDMGPDKCGERAKGILHGLVRDLHLDHRKTAALIKAAAANTTHGCPICGGKFTMPASGTAKCGDLAKVVLNQVAGNVSAARSRTKGHLKTAAPAGLMTFQRRLLAQGKADVGYPKALQKSEAVSPRWSWEPPIMAGWRRQVVDIEK